MFCFSDLIRGQNKVTVQDLIVEYMPELIQGQQASLDRIICKPNIRVTLSTTDSVSVVFLKVTLLNSDTVVYEVNYNLSLHQLLDEEGTEVYSRVGNIIHIKSMPTVQLQPYVFELYTLDITGRKSEIFSKIQ